MHDDDGFCTFKQDDLSECCLCGGGREGAFWQGSAHLRLKHVPSVLLRNACRMLHLDPGERSKLVGKHRGALRLLVVVLCEAVVQAIAAASSGSI